MGQGGREGEEEGVPEKNIGVALAIFLECERMMGPS